MDKDLSFDKTGIPLGSLEYKELNELYDECIRFLKTAKVADGDDEEREPDQIQQADDDQENIETSDESIDPKYETIIPMNSTSNNSLSIDYRIESDFKSNDSIRTTAVSVDKLPRLIKLSQQLPKIVITQSNASLCQFKSNGNTKYKSKIIDPPGKYKSTSRKYEYGRPPPLRNKIAYGDYPKRLVSKNGAENVALISNVPFGKLRLLNDTFHTLINLRWRWIIIATVVLHFAVWLVFAVFWYITAFAHYDFEPNPPNKSCITGGKDFVTIFLASVEAQTTIGFGDRAIDEECPESIFLFIMQLILGTGLSGVLTCVVYAKLTRPEKLSRDGVGFSKKALIGMRDGKLCLMFRVWDLNYDHIISTEFTAHFINTLRTKEGEVMRYYARALNLQQQEFLLWPVVMVHEIDASSPLYTCSPQTLSVNNFEITVSLKGASASMGTFTQSQTSYLPKEILWGYRFLPVVSYDNRKMKYVIDHKNLNSIEPCDTPYCSAASLQESNLSGKSEPIFRPSTPSSFSEKVSELRFARTSSFKKKYHSVTYFEM